MFKFFKTKEEKHQPDLNQFSNNVRDKIKLFLNAIQKDGQKIKFSIDRFDKTNQQNDLVSVVFLLQIHGKTSEGEIKLTDILNLDKIEIEKLERTFAKKLVGQLINLNLIQQQFNGGK